MSRNKQFPIKEFQIYARNTKKKSHTHSQFKLILTNAKAF